MANGDPTMTGYTPEFVQKVGLPTQQKTTVTKRVCLKTFMKNQKSCLKLKKKE